MKQFAIPFAVRAAVLASLALTGACSDKNDDPTPFTTGFNWTADNTTYSSTTATATATNQGLLISLTGTFTSSSGSNVINLAVPAAVGTYSTTVPTTAAYYYMSYSIRSGNSSIIYAASNAGGTGSGTITITALSATDVVGTFSFTGAVITGNDTKVVTNGKFNVKR